MNRFVDASWRLIAAVVLVTLAVPLVPSQARAQADLVRWDQLISEQGGAFGGKLREDDVFGWAVASVGDLDGDQIEDIAVGAPGDNDGDGDDSGAVWILFLAADGTVRDQTKISDDQGNFSGKLDAYDFFGYALAPVGDLDDDGNVELAVGAPGDDDGSGLDRGAVWILFLNDDGTVRSDRKISSDAGDFEGDLDPVDRFGSALAPLGDLNGDEHPDLAVGAPGTNSGNNLDEGAVWILLLDELGRVLDERMIADDENGFVGDTRTGDEFGFSIANLGDISGDDVVDLAVGAPGDDDGNGVDSGAFWVLFLNSSGVVIHDHKVSDIAGGFEGEVREEDRFGRSLAAIDDLDGDGIGELLVGAPGDNDGNDADSGAFWRLYLDDAGMVKSEEKVSDTAGGFDGEIKEGDTFGYSLAVLEDRNGDGLAEYVVGAPGDNDGDPDAGAVWLLWPSPMCGDPKPDRRVTATDALLTLQTAVDLVVCEACVCDADASGRVVATDALLILQRSVDAGLELACPVCAGL